MTDHLCIALAQLNLLVGDTTGNLQQMVDAACRARDELGAQAVVFPELAITGYPPDDLLLRRDFLQEVAEAVDSLAAQVHGITLMVGTPRVHDGHLYNAAVVLRDGHLQGCYFKQRLPTYGVFDDRRYFTPGERACVVEVAGCPVAVTVCEDVWHPEPAAQAAAAGARLLVNINASPFDRYKWMAREGVLRERIGETGLAMLYCNMAGGQDEVVYDGDSCAFDSTGRLMMRAPRFRTGLYPVDLELQDGRWEPTPGPLEEDASDEACVYEALVTGVRDYIDKNGFPGALIGLSGGMDSALVLAVAADGLGPERVEAVMMPTRYTSELSHSDAAEIASRLGVAYRVVEIEAIYDGFLAALAPAFGDAAPDITEENLQSRARGTVLMALSNKQGKLVLATGNKSELAVGYATLYGDMVGGFAPLKDVFKTEAYRLARYRNELSAVIPESVFSKPPTAELRPDQKDSDSLPDYAVLDAILAAYVEDDRSEADIAADGHPAELVGDVVRMVHRNEYKRRQAPPGVKITAKAFGRDRRYPITSGFGRRRPWTPS